MREDGHNKEPKSLIAKTFIFGILSGLGAVVLENIIALFSLSDDIQVVSYAFIEEFVKLFAVFLAALGTVWNNEREDPMIYMITGALGFAGIENMFYIIDYINNHQYIQSLIDGGYRFIGS